MVDEVGGFVDETVAVAIDGFNHTLDSLFAHLLSNLLHPFDKQTGGVGAFGHLTVATGDNVGQATHKTFVFGRVETSGGATVTGGADGVGLDEQSVAVAVGIERHDVEIVAGGFTLGPEGLTCAAVEGDTAFGLGAIEGFFVHIAHHEHLERHGVLHHHGQKTVGAFREIEVGIFHCVEWRWGNGVEGLLSDGDALGSELALEVADGDFTKMENAGG